MISRKLFEKVKSRAMLHKCSSSLRWRPFCLQLTAVFTAVQAHSQFSYLWCLIIKCVLCLLIIVGSLSYFILVIIVSVFIAAAVTIISYKVALPFYFKYTSGNNSKQKKIGVLSVVGATCTKDRLPFVSFNMRHNK